MNQIIKIAAGVIMVAVGIMVVKDNPTAGVFSFVAAVFAFIPPFKKRSE
ncbi:hypothetical protein G7068_03235 [Leucobacter viscericola]|uniref:Uncharacterized protein n=1 Tax=Leucobacter viscericola TaxID=2714935 RepID=A0A6G7XD76_9MICO|nr:hypothetical protein [Leucobacter viscericola]QIK62328.1 hypothetical protein G7068_03235 [Leucobacter viscericola]